MPTLGTLDTHAIGLGYFALYQNVPVYVVARRPVTGGAACDVQIPNGVNAPWTVRAWTTAESTLRYVTRGEFSADVKRCSRPVNALA